MDYSCSLVRLGGREHKELKGKKHKSEQNGVWVRNIFTIDYMRVDMVSEAKSQGVGILLQRKKNTFTYSEKITSDKSFKKNKNNKKYKKSWEKNPW